MSKHSEPSVFMTAGTLAPGEGGGSMRDALRAWLARLSVGDALPIAAPEIGRVGDSALPGVATAFENRIRAVRANARAACRSVECARDVDGPDAAALEAALDVVEAAWRSALADRDGYAETLKSIRLYAPDPRCRAMAAASLSAASPCTRSSGYDRFPFNDDFDA